MSSTITPQFLGQSEGKPREKVLLSDGVVAKEPPADEALAAQAVCCGKSRLFFRAAYEVLGLDKEGTTFACMDIAGCDCGQVSDTDRQQHWEYVGGREKKPNFTPLEEPVFDIR